MECFICHVYFYLPNYITKPYKLIQEIYGRGTGRFLGTFPLTPPPLPRLAQQLQISSVKFKIIKIKFKIIKIEIMIITSHDYYIISKGVWIKYVDRTNRHRQIQIRRTLRRLP